MEQNVNFSKAKCKVRRKYHQIYEKSMGEHWTARKGNVFGKHISRTGANQILREIVTHKNSRSSNQTTGISFISILKATDDVTVNHDA